MKITYVPLTYLLTCVLILIFVTSCNHDRVGPEPQDTETQLDLRNLEDYSHESDIEDKPITLEELNKVMREYGLSEFSMEDLQKKAAVLRSCNNNCSNIEGYGDFNGNNGLTAQDIAEMRIYVCNNGGDCSNPYNEYLDLSGGSHPLNAWNAALVSMYSTFGPCNGSNMLDRDDWDSVAAYLLGIIC